MATRWIVPCGCEMVYEMDGENAITQSFKPCDLHKDVSIDQAHSTAIAYCRQIAVESQEGND